MSKWGGLGWLGSLKVTGNSTSAIAVDDAAAINGVRLDATEI